VEVQQTDWLERGVRPEGGGGRVAQRAVVVANQLRSLIDQRQPACNWLPL
jgi:hypothetical protein